MKETKDPHGSAKEVPISRGTMVTVSLGGQWDGAEDIPHVPAAQRTAAERFTTAVRGPSLGLGVNLVLVIVKAVAGVASGSAALLADAGHSGADLANNLFVLASLFYSRRPADETHPHGHDRAEVLAALGSAFLLASAGLFFGWDSIQKLITGEPMPSLLALWVAVGTLLVKLVVVRIESAIAANVTSLAIRADARDSLTDVLSSIAVIIGVIGAQLGQPRLDGVAGVVIALLILVTAIQIGTDASQELLEHNLDPTLLARVRSVVGRVPEVYSIAAVTGRAHGSDILLELSIEVDAQMTVEQASVLTERVRSTIYASMPEVGDAVIELNTNHLARLRQRLC